MGEKKKEKHFRRLPFAKKTLEGTGIFGKFLKKRRKKRSKKTGPTEVEKGGYAKGSFIEPGKDLREAPLADRWDTPNQRGPLKKDLVVLLEGDAPGGEGEGEG